MANTYEWDIQSMACYPTYQSQSNVVFTVNTLITATSDTEHQEIESYLIGKYSIDIMPASFNFIVWSVTSVAPRGVP